MPWLVATLVSAFFLGCYDLCTKHAVRDNAVLPVLFFANVCSATVWGALMLVHAWQPDALPASLVVAPLTPLQFIERAGYVYPNHTSVIHGAKRYTWRETYARCRRLGSALASL